MAVNKNDATHVKKSTLGRKALPETERQGEIIRERVKPGVFESYVKLGGKAFLLAVIEDRIRDYQPGKRIKATFVPQAWQNDYAIDVDPEGDTRFDVTHLILAMGKDRALALRENSLACDYLRNSANAPKWIRDWTGPFRIEVEDEIQDYFEETTA